MSATPHLDDQIIATLRDVMGEEYALLIDTYLADSHARLNALGENIISFNAEAVRRTAHSFKGSSSNIGALQLAAYCSALEALALAGDSQSWPAQLLLIEAEFAEVSRLLRHDL